MKDLPIRSSMVLFGIIGTALVVLPHYAWV